jgi:hypothetical protein
MLSGFVGGLIPVSTVTVVPVLCKRMTPALAIYTEAVNKFTKSAKVFMEHMHLLNEARYEYQKAPTTSTPLRNLDAGDQALRSLMTQLEQVGRRSRLRDLTKHLATDAEIRLLQNRV